MKYILVNVIHLIKLITIEDVLHLINILIQVIKDVVMCLLHVWSLIMGSLLVCFVPVIMCWLWLSVGMFPLSIVINWKIINPIIVSDVIPDIMLQVINFANHFHHSVSMYPNKNVHNVLVIFNWIRLADVKTPIVKNKEIVSDV